MKHPLSRLAPAWALCLPLLATAQAPRPDPADPKAPAPALRYDSAFTDYKPWQDASGGDWRAVNDTVRRAAAKGDAHAGHAAPPSPAAASAASPAHGHHQRMHGGKP